MSKKIVNVPDGYYMQDEDRQGWTFYETQKDRVPLNKPLDYISRQAAIEAIERIDWYHINQNGELVSGANSQEHEPLYKASDIYAALEQVPSAQPEIIACGDCKYWICHDRRCGYWNHGVKPLDWCCHAERRTDG